MKCKAELYCDYHINYYDSYIILLCPLVSDAENLSTLLRDQLDSSTVKDLGLRNAFMMCIYLITEYVDFFEKESLKPTTDQLVAGNARKKVCCPFPSHQLQNNLRPSQHSMGERASVYLLRHSSFVTYVYLLGFEGHRDRFDIVILILGNSRKLIYPNICSIVSYQMQYQHMNMLSNSLIHLGSKIIG